MSLYFREGHIPYYQKRVFQSSTAGCHNMELIIAPKIYNNSELQGFTVIWQLQNGNVNNLIHQVYMTCGIYFMDINPQQCLRWLGEDYDPFPSSLKVRLVMNLDQKQAMPAILWLWKWKKADYGAFVFPLNVSLSQGVGPLQTKLFQKLNGNLK